MIVHLTANRRRLFVCEKVCALSLSSALSLTHPLPLPLFHISHPDYVGSSSHFFFYSLSRLKSTVLLLIIAQTASGYRFYFCFLFFSLEIISQECLCQFALRARRLVQCCKVELFLLCFEKNIWETLGTRCFAPPWSRVPCKASGRVSWGLFI